MKKFVLALLVAVCLAAAPVAIADVPDISHVAEDGSYRDNTRGVWVDSCGEEHVLCATQEICAPEKECPVPEVCEPVETIIALSCPLTQLTQEEINAIAATTVSMIEFPEVDSRPDFIKSFAVSAVVGGNHFRGVQARHKFFGIRVGKMDVSDFMSVPGRTSDPLDDFNMGTSVLAGKPGDDDTCTQICHRGTTLCIAQPGAVNGHLGHGDTLGECDSDPDPEEPFCGDGVQDVGEDCNTCPVDILGVCGDGDPGDPTDLGFKRVDDTAETLEVFVYLDTIFKGDQRDCRDEDGEVRPLCRLGLYVGGGVVRVEETRILERNGVLRQGDNRFVFKPTATAGVEYIFPFRLVVGAGYHTEAGMLVHAGYGITW